MNNVKLVDFKPKTLLQVSRLIDRRIIRIRETKKQYRSNSENEELENLLEFQTQILYAHQLVSREEKVTNGYGNGDGYGLKEL